MATFIDWEEFILPLSCSQSEFTNKTIVFSSPKKFSGHHKQEKLSQYLRQTPAWSKHKQVEICMSGILFLGMSQDKVTPLSTSLTLGTRALVLSPASLCSLLPSRPLVHSEMAAQSTSISRLHLQWGISVYSMICIPSFAMITSAPPGAGRSCHWSCTWCTPWAPPPPGCEQLRMRGRCYPGQGRGHGGQYTDPLIGQCSYVSPLIGWKWPPRPSHLTLRWPVLTWEPESVPRVVGL